MDEIRVTTAMQNLWAAIHDMDTPPPPQPKQEMAPSGSLTDPQEEMSAKQLDIAKAKRDLYAADHEMRLKQQNSACYGAGASQSEAPRERLRTHSGSLGGASLAPPTPQNYTISQALERQEMAVSGLHMVIDELEERLVNVTVKADKDPGVVPSPNGVGYAFRAGLTAVSIEGTVYRLRSLIERLIVGVVLFCALACTAHAQVGASGAVAFYLNNETGRVWAKNTTSEGAVLMLALFDATNPNNQVDLGARSAVYLAPGDSTILTVGLQVPRCRRIRVQPDVWINPPPVGPNGRYTLGELTLYAGGSTRDEEGDMSGCFMTPNPNPNPTPTPEPQCEPFTMQFNYGAGDWIMSVPPGLLPSGIPGVWPYPSSVGPYSLALTAGIPPGTYDFWATNNDPFHLTNPDFTPNNEHEQLRHQFLPSGLVTGVSDDIPSYVTSNTTYVGRLTFTETQTHIRAVHATPVGVEASDSLRPEYVRWRKVC